MDETKDVRDVQFSRAPARFSEGVSSPVAPAVVTQDTSASETTGTSEGTTSGESTTTGESSETTTDGPYSVSMAPVGEVEFESVPKTWVANNGSWADMGIALGLEPPKAVWLTDRYHTQYYDAIDGLSVDKSDMVSLYQDGVSKELFYQLDADVHVMDPNFLMNRFKGWKRTDVDELEQNIAPLFGNCIYAQHYTWHDSYLILHPHGGLRNAVEGVQATRPLRGVRGPPRRLPVERLRRRSKEGRASVGRRRLGRRLLARRSTIPTSSGREPDSNT